MFKKRNQQQLCRWHCCASILLTSLFLALTLIINWPNSGQCLLGNLVPANQRAKHEYFAVPHDDISRIRPVYAIPDLGFYFHAAYCDTRQTAHRIRILGIYKNDSNLEGFWCNWNSTTGIIHQVKASCQPIDSNWPLSNKYFAFMMTCQLEGSVPLQVTVSRGRHDVILPVHEAKPAFAVRHTLAVCVKPMTGQFSVSRIVEWLELHMAAGYDNIILYDTDVQGSTRYVLEYYENKGLLTVRHFPFLMAILSLAERKTSIGDNLRYALYQQVYLVALHDCILRFYPSYRYLAMVDLDEVILPAKNRSIIDLVAEVERHIPNVVSYMFYTYWHFQEFSPPSPNISDHLYIQKTASAPQPSLDQPKSLILTSLTLTVNWHGVLDVLDSAQIPRYLLSSTEHGAVHHFRSGRCQEHFHDLCPNMTSSSSPCPEVQRYRDATEIAVRNVLNYLQL